MTEHRAAMPRRSKPEQMANRDGGRFSADFDERFLLTPPAVDNATTNPFEEAKPSDAQLHLPSQLSQLLEQNARAYRQNAQIHTTGGESPPGTEAANMLKELRLKTDWSELHRTDSTASTDSYADSRLRSSTSAASLPLRIPSVRNRLHSTAGSVSPGSVISSPMLAAILDITPLPSPTMAPDEWRALARSRSRASSTSSRSDFPPYALQTSPPRKKGYGTLPQIIHIGRKSISDDAAPKGHETRDGSRSISQYTPEVIASFRPRKIAVSGGPPVEVSTPPTALHREDFLGGKRGIKISGSKERSVLPPIRTPSSSADEGQPLPKRARHEVWSAQSVNSGATKHYEAIKPLGQGTFSKVYLAVHQVHDRQDSVDYRTPSIDMAGVQARSRRLVAIKVVEPGPAGGADAERIEVSLKREVELMKRVQHPSIIHLKAFGTEANGRALLVMNYCPGGDLFELASMQNVLTPPLIRRIFSELVSGVRFLHQRYIVHRDIKLENVLLNIPAQVHGDVHDWQKLDRAVVTLTDLGLSRSIPQPPESPLLETRCGSEDYAAPEILMGQPYDGRQTDAWALGVLLYSLMEGRLPFDPLPGARGDPATLRARTPHRIARCEWAWVKYGDEDGDWDTQKGKDLDGAMHCVDALLKRNTRRKPLADIREWPWVRDGIQVDGGLRWVEEEDM